MTLDPFAFCPHCTPENGPCEIHDRPGRCICFAVDTEEPDRLVVNDQCPEHGVHAERAA